MYCPIRSSADCEALQRDLDSLERWGMKFSIKKVKLCPSPVESDILPICITYDGHVLSSVQIAKYIGIILTDELSWSSSHVHSIHSRANSILGFLRRTLRRCSAKLKETAYIMLVRSTLEYAASFWDPHLSKDCDLLEKLQ